MHAAACRLPPPPSLLLKQGSHRPVPLCPLLRAMRAARRMTSPGLILVPYKQAAPPVLSGLHLAVPAGVVVSDILKHFAACPSLSYWIRATAMIPVTIVTLLAVRWAGLPRAPVGTSGHAWLHGAAAKALHCGVAWRGVGAAATAQRWAQLGPIPRPRPLGCARFVLPPMACCASHQHRLAACGPRIIATRRTYLLRKGEAQRAAGYQLLEGDVHWTPASTLVYPALCSFAGVCAGIFGVGGGIIKVGTAGCLPATCLPARRPARLPACRLAGGAATWRGAAGLTEQMPGCAAASGNKPLQRGGGSWPARSR